NCGLFSSTGRAEVDATATVLRRRAPRGVKLTTSAKSAVAATDAPRLHIRARRLGCLSHVSPTSTAAAAPSPSRPDRVWVLIAPANAATDSTMRNERTVRGRDVSRRPSTAAPIQTTVRYRARLVGWPIVEKGRSVPLAFHTTGSRPRN